MQYIIYFLLLVSVCNGEKSMKVDIYPGFGWDHLRFIDMSPIFDVSNFNDSDVFQACIEMIPLHENKIETGSTVIDAFDSRTNDHSTSILIGASGGYGGFKLSGSYSNEHQKIKHEQGEHKTITLRNHIDYLMVEVILQSTCPLNPQVKKDLIEIAKYITTNQQLRATYAAQIFVKKYGTHFTSRLQLGGSISEDDYVSHDNFYASDSEKQLHKAAAELSFLSTYSLTASFSSANNDTETNQHKQNINRKVISSKGGDVFISGNHMEAWQQSVKSRPAIVKRAIENVTYFIQSDKIPELTDIAIALVRQKISDAINTYVEMNAVRGCMHRDSPSFNWVANVDDGSCAPADQNSQFGGFIRTCREDEGLTPKCDSYRINNFYTDNDQCKPGFSKYVLHRSIQIEEIFIQECYGCGFMWLSTCCDNILNGTGQREVDLYSCTKNITQNPASLGAEDTDLMHVYGGSFTTKKVNPVTDSFACPRGFSEVNALDDMKICLAEKIETHTDTLPRYGGIYSCDYGNIATDTGAKACPAGYSVYVMGAIDGDCLLNVCLKFDTFDDIRNFPAVVLPPFFDLDLVNRTTETNETMINGNITGRMRNTARSASSSSGKSHHVEIGLSVGAIFIGVVAVAAVGITQVKKYRKRRANNHSDSNNMDLAVIKT